MLTLIEWKDDYALGIPEVDFEHREMIALINKLYGSMHDGAHAQEVQTFLAEVHARIAAHFALEERLMRQIRYHEYAAHKADHELLLDDILDIMDAAEGEDDFDPDELAARLDHWFSDHFKTFDSRLHGATG
jgi:hemerythrin